MVHGRNTDRGGLDFCRLETLFHGCVDGHPPLLFQRGSAVCGGLDNGRQMDRKAGMLQVAVNAQMVATKGSCSTNDDVLERRGDYRDAPFPSTTCRQRE